jgi:hypothetical protein
MKRYWQNDNELAKNIVETHLPMGPSRNRKNGERFTEGKDLAVPHKTIKA